MLQQTPGRIFLSDQRELLETKQFQRYSLYQGGPPPARGFQALHEESLAGGAQAELAAPTAMHVLIIPITGAVQLEIAPGIPTLMHVEEIHAATVPAGSRLRFSNPYPADTISFLHLWVVASADALAAPVSRIFDFDMQALANQLVEATQLLPILPRNQRSGRLPFRVSLGRFAGRQEAVYKLSSPAAQVFAFVLAGAFEVEGRLLHEKDGLSLWDTPTVEIEALSNDALLVIVELTA